MTSINSQSWAHRTWRLALIVTLLAGVALPAVPSKAGPGQIKLAPHRAVYEITLERTASGSGIVELTGRMVYEITGNVCSGYKQNMRFVTRSVNRAGKPSIMDLRSSFWEDGAGERFRFDTNQYRDERLTESASGNARRDKAKSAVAVKIDKPKKKVLELDQKILFPVQHSVEILAAAKEGKTIYTSDLYDGSEKGLKVYSTTAVLGQRKAARFNATLEPVKNGEVLDALEAWPVSLSYFDREKGGTDALPSYELAFLFFENGVSRRLLIDYGQFAIRGRLSRLEMLKETACAK